MPRKLTAGPTSNFSPWREIPKRLQNWRNVVMSDLERGREEGAKVVEVADGGGPKDEIRVHREYMEEHVVMEYGGDRATHEGAAVETVPHRAPGVQGRDHGEVRVRRADWGCL